MGATKLTRVTWSDVLCERCDLSMIEWRDAKLARVVLGWRARTHRQYTRGAGNGLWNAQAPPRGALFESTEDVRVIGRDGTAAVVDGVASVTVRNMVDAPSLATRVSDSRRSRTLEV